MLENNLVLLVLAHNIITISDHAPVEKAKQTTVTLRGIYFR